MLGVDMKTVRRVFVTGGREVGGVRAFADALRGGFMQAGFETVVVEKPVDMFALFRYWRTDDSLWIISTWGLLFSPLLRRSVGVAHGTPLPRVDGVFKAFVVAISLRFSGIFSPLVAVSGYTAVQLRNLCGVDVRSVIYNPLREEFFGASDFFDARKKVTYIGRMIEVKQIELLLDAFDLLDLGSKGYELAVVGDGPLADKIECRVHKIPGATFTRNLDANGVRNLLNQTKVFYSGCLIEAFGISLLEAYASGANVVCPSVGGFVEVMIGELGRTVFIFPPAGGSTEVAECISRALMSPACPRAFDEFAAASVAGEYIVVAS